MNHSSSGPERQLSEQAQRIRYTSIVTEKTFLATNVVSQTQLNKLMDRARTSLSSLVFSQLLYESYFSKQFSWFP